MTQDKEQLAALEEELAALKKEVAKIPQHVHEETAGVREGARDMQQACLEETRSFREFLERIVRFCGWCGAGMLAFFLVVVGYVGFSELPAAVNFARQEAIDSIDGAVKKRLSKEGFSEAIDQQIAQATTTAEDILERDVYARLDDFEAEVDAALQHQEVRLRRFMDEPAMKTLQEDVQEAGKEVISRLRATESSDIVGATLLPIGAIIAWPGPIKDANGTYIGPSGWRECDGTEIANVQLEQVLGNTYGEASNPGRVVLPDYREYFLRGAGSRAEKLGSPQAFATAMPANRFSIPQSGEHGHPLTISRGTIQRADKHPAIGDENDPVGTYYVGESGEHSHAIRGGDRETRPINFAVHWLIRIE